MSEIKKGYSKFQLLGTVKLNDKTFAINQKGKNRSSYIYNSLNLGIDCGVEESNVIYATLLGGYDTTRQNIIYCHGVKEENGKLVDNFDEQIQVDFQDRNKEDKNIAPSCYITVGIVKDVNDRIVEKKFLSAYDVIEYLKESLVDGMEVSVRGNLKYSSYQGKTQVKKEITSIWLSTAKKEDFKATFNQTVWFTQESFGEKDENGYLPLYGYAVDYYNKDVGNVCYPITLEIDTNVMKKYEMIIKTYLRPNNAENVNKVVVEGRWIKTDNGTDLKYEDLSDDLKQMVDLGMLDEQEALGRAVGSTRGEFKTLFKSICTKRDSSTGMVSLLVDSTNTKVDDIIKVPEENKGETVLKTIGSETETKKVTPIVDDNDDDPFADLFN